jgi:cysteinyl-tRNA synthetase
VLLSTHYRQGLNFTFDSLGAARSALGRLDEFRGRLASAAAAAAPGPLPAWAQACPALFHEALADDLNISAALGVLFDLVHVGNRAVDAGESTPAAAAAVLALLDTWDRILGVLAPEEDAADEAVVELARLRDEARKARNWAEADRLRREIGERGWVVQDTAQGAKLKRK